MNIYKKKKIQFKLLLIVKKQAMGTAMQYIRHLESNCNRNVKFEFNGITKKGF